MKLLMNRKMQLQDYCLHLANNIIKPELRYNSALAESAMFTQPVLLIIAIRLLLNSDVQTSFSDELPVCQGL